MDAGSYFETRVFSSPGFGIRSNHTLAILVKLYGKNHDIDTAFSYVDALTQKYGFEPNAQVYTALMSACVSTGHMQKAEEVPR